MLSLSKHDWYRLLAAALLLPLALSSTPAYALRAGLEGRESEVGRALSTRSPSPTPAAGAEEGLTAFGALAGTWRELPGAPHGFKWYEVTFLDRSPAYVQTQYDREAEPFERVQAQWLRRVAQDPAAPRDKYYVTTGDVQSVRSVLPQVAMAQFPDARLGFMRLLESLGPVAREDVLATYTIDLLMGFAHTIAAEVGRTQLSQREQQLVRDVTVSALKELNAADAAAAVAATTRFLNDAAGNQGARMVAVRREATNAYNAWLSGQVRELLTSHQGPIWIDAQNASALLALAPEGSVAVGVARTFLERGGQGSPEGTLRVARALLASSAEELPTPDAGREEIEEPQSANELQRRAVLNELRQLQSSAPPQITVTKVWDQAGTGYVLALVQYRDPQGRRWSLELPDARPSLLPPWAEVEPGASWAYQPEATMTFAELLQLASTANLIWRDSPGSAPPAAGAEEELPRFYDTEIAHRPYSALIEGAKALIGTAELQNRFIARLQLPQFFHGALQRWITVVAGQIHATDAVDLTALATVNEASVRTLLYWAKYAETLAQTPAPAARREALLAIARQWQAAGRPVAILRQFRPPGLIAAVLVNRGYIQSFASDAVTLRQSERRPSSPPIPVADIWLIGPTGLTVDELLRLPDESSPTPAAGLEEPIMVKPTTGGGFVFERDGQPFYTLGDKFRHLIQVSPEAFAVLTRDLSKHPGEGPSVHELYLVNPVAGTEKLVEGLNAQTLPVLHPTGQFMVVSEGDSLVPVALPEGIVRSSFTPSYERFTFPSDITIAQHTIHLAPLAFSQDGRWLLTACTGYTTPPSGPWYHPFSGAVVYPVGASRATGTVLANTDRDVEIREAIADPDGGFLILVRGTSAPVAEGVYRIHPDVRSDATRALEGLPQRERAPTKLGRPLALTPLLLKTPEQYSLSKLGLADDGHFTVSVTYARRAAEILSGSYRVGGAAPKAEKSLAAPIRLLPPTSGSNTSSSGLEENPPSPTALRPEYKSATVPGTGGTRSPDSTSAAGTEEQSAMWVGQIQAQVEAYGWAVEHFFKEGSDPPPVQLMELVEPVARALKGTPEPTRVVAAIAGVQKALAEFPAPDPTDSVGSPIQALQASVEQMARWVRRAPGEAPDLEGEDALRSILVRAFGSPEAGAPGRTKPLDRLHLPYRAGPFFLEVEMIQPAGGIFGYDARVIVRVGKREGDSLFDTPLDDHEQAAVTQECAHRRFRVLHTGTRGTTAWAPLTFNAENRNFKAVLDVEDLPWEPSALVVEMVPAAGLEEAWTSQELYDLAWWLGDLARDVERNATSPFGKVVARRLQTRIDEANLFQESVFVPRLTAQLVTQLLDVTRPDQPLSNEQRTLLEHGQELVSALASAVAGRQAGRRPPGESPIPITVDEVLYHVQRYENAARLLKTPVMTKDRRPQPDTPPGMPLETAAIRRLLERALTLTGLNPATGLEQSPTPAAGLEEPVREFGSVEAFLQGQLRGVQLTREQRTIIARAGNVRAIWDFPVVMPSPSAPPTDVTVVVNPDQFSGELTNRRGIPDILTDVINRWNGRSEADHLGLTFTMVNADAVERPLRSLAVGVAIDGTRVTYEGLGIPTITFENYKQLLEIGPLGIYAVAQHKRLRDRVLPSVTDILHYVDAEGRSRTAIFL